MRELSGDRGAIAVLTALVGSMMLLACAAIAVDVAVLYSERRQLQNGADAAAIAIAQSCVRSLDTSPTAPCSTGLASALANENAVDGAATVSLVCGTAPGLGSCSAGNGSRAACNAPPAGSPPYVEVHTTTRTAGGSNVVAPVFARVLPGFEGYAGTAVGACARAGYGAPSTVFSVLPVTVSQCVVNLYRTDHENRFAPMSLLTAGVTAQRPWETQVVLHKASGACSDSASGQNTGGNFGFLVPTAGAGCVVTTTVGSTMPGSPGNSPPSICTDSYLASLLGKTVYIPVFDTLTASGNNVSFHIVGYAAFYFTGWKLVNSADHVSILTGQMPCPQGPETCVEGIFVRGLQPTPGVISSASTSSANVVQLLG